MSKIIPKTILVVIGSILAAILAICTICAFCVSMFFVLGFDQYGTYYSVEQSDVRSYKRIVGNQNNEIPTEFISSYFPEQIEPFFSNAVYHYRAQRPGNYACEAMLQFTIEDTAAFEAYYDTLQQYGVPQAFLYDSNYAVWLIADSLQLYYHTEFREEPELSISHAELGFILCDKQSHKFVYAALLVAEGGSTPVKELDYIWESFDIELTEQTQAILSVP